MYVDRTLTKGVVQVVRNPTRYQVNCRPSLIDHVYTGSPQHITTDNLISGTSDHNPTCMRQRKGANIEKCRIIKKKVYALFTEKDFEDELSKEN